MRDLHLHDLVGPDLHTGHLLGLVVLPEGQHRIRPVQPVTLHYNRTSEISREFSWPGTNCSEMKSLL